MSAVLGSTPDVPAPAPRAPRWRRRIIVGSVGLLLVGGLTAAGFGARWYLHTGAQPAEALPASTLAYLAVDLDPSGKEKLAVKGILDKLPIAKSDRLGGVGDLREEIVDKILQSSGCSSMSFDHDVSPWLGERAAVAVVKVDAGPRPVIVLQSSDDTKADQGMHALSQCGGSDFGSWDVHDGWILWGPSQSVVDAVAQGDKGGTLADSSDFRSAIDAAGGPGLVSGYVSKDAGSELLPMMGPMTRQLPAVTLDKVVKQFPRVGLSVRADGGQVRMTVVSTSPQASAHRVSGDVSSEMGSLPSDTTAAMAFDLKGLDGTDAMSNLRTGFRAGFDRGLAQSGAPSEVGRMVQHFQSVLGAPLDKVLADLVDGSFTAALGPASLDAVEQSPDNLPLALELTPGASRARVFDYYRRLAADQPIASWTSTSPTSLVFGTSKDYRDQVLSGAGHLADSDTFSSVVDLRGHDVLGALYVDLQSGLVKEGISRGLAPQDPRWLDNVRHLEAVGLTMSRDGDTGTVELRISLN